MYLTIIIMSNVI